MKINKIASGDSHHADDKGAIPTDDAPGEDEIPVPFLVEKYDCKFLYICYPRVVCKWISLNSAFNLLITVFIVVNTLLLSLDSYSYPVSLKKLEVLEVLNEILHWIFCAEMIIKLLGLGPKRYAQDSFNIFDGTVVIISLAEYIVT